MASPRESVWGKTSCALERGKMRAKPDKKRILCAKELGAGVVSQNEILMYLIMIHTYSEKYK